MRRLPGYDRRPADNELLRAGAADSNDHLETIPLAVVETFRRRRGARIAIAEDRRSARSADPCRRGGLADRPADA